MPWFEITDPRGAAGHRFGSVAELSFHVGNALWAAGRAVPARQPIAPTADAELPKKLPAVAEQIDEALGAPVTKADDLEEKTVAELKALLLERGLPATGKRADLLSRLRGE